MSCSLSRLSLWMIIAALPLCWLRALPDTAAIQLLLGLIALLLITRQRWLRESALVLLLFIWAVIPAKTLLQQTAFLSAAPVEAVVGIEQLQPQSQRVKIRIESVAEKRLFPPVYALIAIPGTQTFCPGQHWRMKLRLRPVHARLNEGGFDAQRFALAVSTPLTGRALTWQIVDSRCGWREKVMQKSRDYFAALPWHSVILALTFGERSELSSETKALLRETGTAHLMAISGMHIGLAASVGWLIARIFQPCFRASWIEYRFPLFSGIALALIYCWLSGGSPPALRAIVALLSWSLLRLKGRNCSGWQVWRLCIGAILFFDPLSILSDSLWLSAVAVAGLLLWYQWFPLSGRFIGKKRWLPLQLLHLQTGLFLLLMPLQIFIFHGVSVSALLANLWAVPLVTLLTVPLILGAVLSLPVASLSQLLWWAADRSLALVFYPLRQLPDGWLTVSQQALWLSPVCLLLLFAWRFHWWRSSPFTLASLCLALLCWRLHVRQPEWRMDMLDIGHGLAVVISQRGNAVVYDTGNRWAGGDAASSQIIPWLRWQGISLQHIILSHGHLDHIGGLESLHKAFPAAKIHSDLGVSGHLPCYQGQNWRWQTLNFQVLWPERPQKEHGNNQSCVVMVTDGKWRVLLTGDIETPAELQLVRRYGEALRADLLQVPHHGSGTSSSPPLLRRVAGQAALASAARYSAWKLPAERIITRYLKNNYSWYDTAVAGQISVEFSKDNWRVLSLRAQIMPRWYHQWFGVTRYSS
ncbi:competence protein ComEC [Erwinia persicina]|uniref:ComEC family protein n=1 Tax=Erwinia persicina TaxID=55211 RepID=UPI00209C7825|nr:ComEC family protein [Erwinia persicina]MCP1437493.1 competence protein ComEC [Erwinia persicina]